MLMPIADHTVQQYDRLIITTYKRGFKIIELIFESSFELLDFLLDTKLFSLPNLAPRLELELILSK